MNPIIFIKCIHPKIQLIKILVTIAVKFLKTVYFYLYNENMKQVKQLKKFIGKGNCMYELLTCSP